MRLYFNKRWGSGCLDLKVDFVFGPSGQYVPFQILPRLKVGYLVRIQPVHAVGVDCNTFIHCSLSNISGVVPTPVAQTY